MRKGTGKVLCSRGRVGPTGQGPGKVLFLSVVRRGGIGRAALRGGCALGDVGTREAGAAEGRNWPRERTGPSNKKARPRSIHPPKIRRELTTADTLNGVC